MLTRQVVDLATKFPEYKDNIATKLHAFRIPESGVFTPPRIVTTDSSAVPANGTKK
jgi:hypothetical protein